MPPKAKDGHVTFSGGQVSLYEPGANGEPRTPQSEALRSSSEDLVDDADDRGAWGGKIEFMLTMISNAVGLGERRLRGIR